MMVSTRGRYALQVMIDLAEHNNGEFIPMKEVAKRQELSLKYLERILPVLSKNNLIAGVHGKGGGYRLNRVPEAYKVGEILRLTEGDLAPVSCLSANGEHSYSKAEYRTMKMWNDFYKITNDFFDNITIADLMNTEYVNNYVI
ncbi:MAG: RrF2 family transcriptional regulator [Ruminococcus sp.]|nr:RrF2 family transcriptional regulator [Ruminococcus sp.]